HGPHQPRCQLDQMVQQRHRLVVDGIVFSCGHGRSSCCRGNLAGQWGQVGGVGLGGQVGAHAGGRWSMAGGGMKGGGGSGGFGPSMNGTRAGGTKGGAATRSGGGGSGSVSYSSTTGSLTGGSETEPAAVAAESNGLLENVSRSVRSGSIAFSTEERKSKLRISLNESLTSFRSASRIISSTWVWNSPAMRRAFLTKPLMARRATGRSLGPITTSATPAIRAISNHAKSNMSLNRSCWRCGPPS